MKRHVLVFDDGSGGDLDLRKFVDGLDPGAQMWTLDGHVCFLVSALSASEISDRLTPVAGSRLFFVADVSYSDYAGRMVGGFWDFIKNRGLPTAAE